MRVNFTCLVLLLVLLQGIGFEVPSVEAAGIPLYVDSLNGRWRVKFTVGGVGEKNLIFDGQAKGLGSVLLLDAGPGNTPAASPLPAAWSLATNDRVNMSAEVELPIGTCCREVGTLVLKGKLGSRDNISGKVIFIGSDVEEENFTGFRTATGTFTATRMLETRSDLGGKCGKTILTNKCAGWVLIARSKRQVFGTGARIPSRLRKRLPEMKLSAGEDQLRVHGILLVGQDCLLTAASSSSRVSSE